MQTGWRGFASKSLEESEKACLDKCSTKYFMLFQRVGFRFAEISAGKEAAANLMAGGAPGAGAGAPGKEGPLRRDGGLAEPRAAQRRKGDAS